MSWSIDLKGFYGKNTNIFSISIIFHEIISEKFFASAGSVCLATMYVWKIPPGTGTGV